MITLPKEQRSLQALLKGKSVKRVLRRRRGELVLEFSDGTRLFVDWKEGKALETSVT